MLVAKQFGYLGQRTIHRVLAIAATLALLQPLLVAVSPEIAGWHPDHEHVYLDGVPRDHSHPWDDDQRAHGHDVRVALSDPIFLPGTVAEPLVPMAAPGSAAQTGRDGVVFLFDLDLFGSVLPALDAHGAPGMVYASGGAPGRGTHGSMSPWEFRTFTVLRGPGLKQGTTLDIPTGHPDIAPTILQLLDLPVPEHMQGRAVREAFVGIETAQAPTTRTLEASRETPAGWYRQRLTVSAMPGGGQHLVAAAFGALDDIALNPEMSPVS